jgi:exodeoxyribonuclease VIII
MHIMIDLETMGTRPSAPIVSIGAVAFDAAGVHRVFHHPVKLDTAVAAGGIIDADTVMWWMAQSDEARAALTTDTALALDFVLGEFAVWIAEHDVEGVWGNGASFDNVLLAESYKRLDMQTPWPFWKDKCYRTAKGMYPEVKMVRSGTHHNALDDARSQAQHLIAINAAAGGIIL